MPVNKASDRMLECIIDRHLNWDMANGVALPIGLLQRGGPKDSETNAAHLKGGRAAMSVELLRRALTGDATTAVCSSIIKINQN